MKRTLVIGLMVVLGLFIAANAALADGPWRGRGGGPCGGGGYCAGPGQGFGPGWDDESVKIRENIFQKRQELRDLMSAKEVDEGKVKALQAEINKLRADMFDKRIQAQLEFKKRNPDWQPRYFGKGPGKGQGRGWRGCPGSGGGGGGCWR